MMRRVKMLVSGRVQGVYFRAFTLKEANRLGIMGNVKNLPDGRVEIIAEAGPETLDKFIKWCRKGPVTARVDHIEIIELKQHEALTAFEVIR